MSAIVKILMGILIAIVRAFTVAFLLLFTKAAIAIVAIVAIVGIVLVLSGALSLDFIRRRRG